MVRRHYSLPSLNALAAFEAAARHLSLTRAAQELNVTPGAVSKQVKMLEDEIGRPLFLRLHRALALTPEGDDGGPQPGAMPSSAWPATLRRGRARWAACAACRSAPPWPLPSSG